MVRPRFVPGSEVAFSIKQRPGPPRDATAYAAVRLAVPPEWVAPLVAEGRVTVDGRVVASGGRVDLARSGEIRIRLPEAWPPHLAARADIPLAVIHEDEGLLAVHKPAGLVVHPARGHLDNRTLANAVRHRYRDDIGRPGVTLGAPHRLDKDTSGVIVFARRTPVYTALVAQFAAQSPHKEYWAAVDGRPGWTATTVDVPLGTDPDHPQRGAVVPARAGGKAARTDLYAMAFEDGRTWIRAVPRTGRAHQIRLHLAHVGHPIQGDRDYNPRDRALATEEDRLRAGRPLRQALHAKVLVLTHPATGDRLRLEADWPDDWPHPPDAAADPDNS